MKLVIHCGLHKTATSSFQKSCSDNRSLLRSRGIHYPKLGEQIQHSGLLWKAQESGLETLGAYLKESFTDASSACHTVLLSGEDFENCIVDVALAFEIETLAYEAGFNAVEWVFVTRPPVDYVFSLYAEMSAHGVVLSRDGMQKAANERGCLYVSSDHYNYIFVFDFDRFAKRFERQTSGQVVRYEFKEFVKEYPGKVLLQQILSEDAFVSFGQAAKISNRQSNERLDSRLVEANYIASALGLARIRRKRFFLLFAPFIWLRRRTARRAQERVSTSGQTGDPSKGRSVDPCSGSRVQVTCGEIEDANANLLL